MFSVSQERIPSPFGCLPGETDTYGALLGACQRFKPPNFSFQSMVSSTFMNKGPMTVGDVFNKQKILDGAYDIHEEEVKFLREGKTGGIKTLSRL